MQLLPSPGLVWDPGVTHPSPWEQLSLGPLPCPTRGHHVERVFPVAFMIPHVSKTSQSSMPEAQQEGNYSCGARAQVWWCLKHHRVKHPQLSLQLLQAAEEGHTNTAPPSQHGGVTLWQGSVGMERAEDDDQTSNVRLTRGFHTF